tara:strand:- start:1977 stop:2342 length:366 start_codon:yes stop_codon:yes gene_type:complete
MHYKVIKMNEEWKKILKAPFGIGGAMRTGQKEQASDRKTLKEDFLNFAHWEIDPTLKELIAQNSNAGEYTVELQGDKIQHFNEYVEQFNNDDEMRKLLAKVYKAKAGTQFDQNGRITFFMR